MNDVALVLGAGPNSNFTIRKIKNLYPDLEVIQVKYPENGGKKNSLVIEKGKELEIISEYIRSKKLALVVNRFDSYIPIHGKLVDTFKIYGPSYLSIKPFRYKALTHKLLEDNGLLEFRPKTKVANISEVENQINNFQYPFVIKPTVGAKSRGVFVVNSLVDLKQALKKIRHHYLESNISRILESPVVLIEEYINGKQIAPVSYVDSEGQLHIVAGVDVVRGPDVGQKHIQNVYRTTPSTMTEKQLLKVKWLLQKLVTISGLKSTFLDPELYWVGERLYIIEINCRLGGFRNTLLKEAYGIDLDKAVIDLALGKKPDLKFTKINNCTACEVWDDRSGQIKAFKLPRNVEYVELSEKYKIGDQYIAPPQNDEPLASYYLKHETDSLKLALEVRKNVQIDIQPE